MIPWTCLATADAPGGGTIRLLRRGAETSIRLGDGNELMNDRLGGSEAALARLALEAAAGLARPRILIGGLGMGFTLRAALAVLPPGARVVVSEIVAALPGWAGAHMADLFDGCLEDPRVTVRIGDVADEIAGGGPWDAILLDVDNGPGGVTRAGNCGLYDDRGLAAARSALAPGGTLAVWSAGLDRAFAARLARAGLSVREHAVRARGGRRGARHVIWIARRAPA